MVSSTVGSPTYTCWKRRSSAGSFSMYLRYSSRVVAPIMRSSPRASIGLIMLPASIAPSAAPAPTMVCSSSMKVMTSPAASVISLRTALSRSSNSPRYLAPATMMPMSSATRRLSFRPSGTSPVGDAPGQALDDGRLADTRLTDQHRVVLGPPREHLDDATDLLVPTDDRVDLAVAGPLGEVLPVLLQGLELVLRVRRGDAMAAPDVAEGLQQLLAVDAQPVAHGQQQVLDREVVVPQVLARTPRPGRRRRWSPGSGAARRRRRRGAAWRRPRRRGCAASAEPAPASGPRPARRCPPGAAARP